MILLLVHAPITSVGVLIESSTVHIMCHGCCDAGDSHSCRTLVHTRLQAFLRVVLQIHGEAVMEHEELRRRASQIEQHLRKSWNRIEALVEQTRCMVGLLSNQQV